MELATARRIIIGALGIGAIGAPAALARPNLEPTTAHATPATSSVAVRPNRDQQLTLASGRPSIPRPGRASGQASINRAKEQEWATLAYRPPPPDSSANLHTNPHATTAAPSGRGQCTDDQKNRRRDR